MTIEQQVAEILRDNIDIHGDQMIVHGAIQKIVELIPLRYVQAIESLEAICRAYRLKFTAHHSTKAWRMEIMDKKFVDKDFFKCIQKAITFAYIAHNPDFKPDDPPTP